MGTHTGPVDGALYQEIRPGFDGMRTIPQIKSVCVCVREREKNRARKMESVCAGETEREREGAREKEVYST